MKSFCYDQIGSLSSLTFIVVKNILEDYSHSEGHQGSLIRSSQLQRAHLKSCSVDLDRLYNIRDGQRMILLFNLSFFFKYKNPVL